MKLNIHKIALLGLSCLLLFSAFPLLQSCKEDEEAMKWVDLRYKLGETPYVFEAKNPAPQVLYVKSTDKWEVFGTQDWYTISPETGDAGEKYEVTITCKENTDLDDRIDTINIKSDYWTGKRFAIIQKGIAYLRTAGTDFEMSKEGDEKSFRVEANQKWTAKVTEGNIWLSIKTGASGELDGTVTVMAGVNKGEKRTGIVTVYDRHGVPQCEVACVQNGVTLSPQEPANGKWFALQPEKQQLEIPITTDVEWTITKENDEDDWFTINASTTQDRLILDIAEHTGRTVREGAVVLTSKAVEGAEPVVKVVKFKQINPLYTITKMLNKTFKAGDSYSEPNMSYGIYHFYLKPPMNVGTLSLQVKWQWGENAPDFCSVSYNLVDGTAKGQTSPWNTLINQATPAYHKALSNPATQEHSMGFKIEEGTKFDSATGKKFANFAWYIDNQVFADFEKINSVYNPATMFWERISAPIGVLSITYSGAASITVEKYDYIPPLDWGE